MAVFPGHLARGRLVLVDVQLMRQAVGAPCLVLQEARPPCLVPARALIGLEVRFDRNWMLS